MLSYVAIANTALQHIGEDDRITNPDEDSRAARAVKRAWETTRLFVLADAHWSFACRTLEIGARDEHPDWPIALGRTAFPLPPDLVNLVEIVDPLFDEPDQFAIEGGPNGSELLVEYAGPIVVRYVRNGPEIADPGRWQPGFTKAFAFYLAWQIADGLSAKQSRKDRALLGYDKAIVAARKQNARTKPRQGNAETDWSRARRSSFAPVPGT